MNSEMYAVNGDTTVPKPTGVSDVYIANGNVSIPKPAGVSEVYVVNGDTSIPKPSGVSDVFIEGLEGTAPSGVSVVSMPNYSGSGPEPGPATPNTLRFKFSNTSYVPTTGNVGYTTSAKGSWTAYDASVGIWDWTCEDVSWRDAFNAGLSSYVLGTGNTAELIAGSSSISATSMYNMFRSCSSLTGVALFDTSSVKEMGCMFMTCSSIKSVPLFNTSSVTSMNQMFNGCTNITDIPLFDTSSVTNMGIMFRDCSSLTKVPLFNTKSVTKMNYMFYGCSKLESIPLFDTDSVTDMSHAFHGCYNVESGALALYTQASTQTTPPSSYNQCFFNCGILTTTGAAELAQIPSSWGGTMS